MSIATFKLCSVFQISWTNAVLTSGNSSGTKLPEEKYERIASVIDFYRPNECKSKHWIFKFCPDLPQQRITSRDCALVAERFIRISSRISSRSRREIRPERRTSSSRRFSDRSNPWPELAADVANPLKCRTRSFHEFPFDATTRSRVLRNVCKTFPSKKCWRRYYLKELPHKHCDCWTKLPSVSRAVLNTTFRAKPAKYRTNLLDRKIEAMFCVARGKR